MPYERSDLAEAIRRRARKSVSGSEIPDTRGSVRELPGGERLASDANARFLDQSGQSIIGIDAVIGTMQT